MAESLIEMHAVQRRFGHGSAVVEAVREASCRIAAGDRIALVGPSGGGKSTLLHLLAGLDQPTSGSVTWPALGTVDALRPLRIGMVFQAPSLVPTLSVVENVALPLLLGGGTLAANARAAALLMLDHFELVELAERLPQGLSGGQAQRVAAARALVTGPCVVLADEPTGQLDRATARTLMATLLVELSRTDAALLVATHDTAVADLLEMRWRMEAGRLKPAPGREAAR